MNNKKDTVDFDIDSDRYCTKKDCKHNKYGCKCMLIKKDCDYIIASLESEKQ